jgi:hypothetical protein
MAGTCNVACAEAHSPGEGEARIDSDAATCPTLSFDRLLIQGKRKVSALGQLRDNTGARNPNILWLAGV